ncbi:MAG: type II toxin-antitoxin system ParD family antitoxin [Hyphomonadaceae bacterium]|nr:type II toxin-antitoxin system ParD family antitoxin [Hyphomonadaceae bacterium]
MSAVRKTITLTAQQDSWIKAQIASGAYTNDSECVRDLIRREQVRTSKLAALQAALEAGEESGGFRTVSVDEIKARMRTKLG